MHYTAGGGVSGHYLDQTVRHLFSVVSSMGQVSLFNTLF